MRAKMILAMLFLTSLAVAAIVVVLALPQGGGGAAEPPSTQEVLVASAPLRAGALLRTYDVVWRPIAGVLREAEIVRPLAAARQARPEIDEEARTAVYGAALRNAVAAGDPIQHNGIVKPGDRDFLEVVLSSGARAIAIPVSAGGASTGLVYPGDRVDVILTQKFNDSAPLTHRSVSETIVENLRVLAIDTIDLKANAFGRTVTLEVIPDQAEKIAVAIELGKLSLTLRSTNSVDDLATTSIRGPDKAVSVKPTWAGDVSPALGGAMPPDKVLATERPHVEIIRGSRSAETVKPQ